MKRFLALAFILTFVFSNARVSDFQRTDSRYERKKTAFETAKASAKKLSEDGSAQLLGMQTFSLF